MKNWRILSTGYRGMPDRFPTYLDAVTKLEIYRISCLEAGPVRACESRR